MVFAMFLLVVSAKAQDIRNAYTFDKMNNTVEFDITKISLFEQRVHFLYLLNNDERFDVSTSDKDGVFVVKQSKNSYNLNLEDTFISFYDNETSVFNEMSKDEVGDMYSEWKASLPDVFNASLMMDLYVKDRQNNLCANSDPFCTDNGIYEFPAGVNAGNGESGPNYDCLHTTPNPAWYYMRMANSGGMTIHMYSTPSEDIDFCCWGPFDDPTSPCPNGLTLAKRVSCSYSSSATENCVIPTTALSGEYYILVITNYSNHQCNITFHKTAGNGTTDCSILDPFLSANTPCYGSTLTLSADIIDGATYNWTGPDNQTHNGRVWNRPNATLNMAGTYTCHVVAGTQSGDESITAVVLPNPIANFTVGNAIAGQPVQFTGTESTNPSGHNNMISSRSWTFGDGGTSNSANPTHTYNTPGTYNVTYTVSITSAHDGLCTDSKTIQVTVGSSMTATITGDNEVCQNESITLHANATGGTGNFHYTWKKNGTQVGTDDPTLTLNMHEAGNITFTCDINDGYTTQTPSFNVLVNALPTAYAGEDQNILYDNSTTLEATAVSGASYSWHPADSIDGNPNQRVVHTKQLKGNNLFTVTVSKNGCSSQDDVIVSVGDQMTAVVSIEDNEICHGESTVVTATAMGGNPEDYTYSWEPANEVQNPHAESTVVTPSVTTDHFTCTISDGHTTVMKTVSITVHPLPIADAGDNITINFDNSATLEAGYIDGASYSWQPADSIVGDNNQRIVHTKQLKTNNTFTVTVSKYGCSTQDDVVVSVGAEMTATVSIEDPEICQYEETIVTAMATGGSPSDYTYSWEPASEVDYPHAASTTVHPSLDTDHFTCTISDGHTTVVKTVNIIVYALPIAQAGEDFSVNYDNPATLTAGEVPDATYEWLPKEMIQDGDNEHQEVTTVPLTEETEFTLIVRRNGCSTEDKVTIFAGNQLQGKVETTNNSICQFDGETNLTVTAFGGNGSESYSYTWSSAKPGVFSDEHSSTTTFSNPTESGEYILKCTIDDTQNTIERSISINVVAQPQATVSVVNPNIINDMPSVVVGKSLTLVASDVNGATYDWQPNTLIASANGNIATTNTLNVAGEYEFTVTVKTQTATNNYCENSASITVKVYDNISATLTPQYTELCEQETLELTASAIGGTGDYKYTWSPANYFVNNIGQTVVTKKLPYNGGLIKFSCKVEDQKLDDAENEKEIEIYMHDKPNINYDLRGIKLVEVGNEFFPQVYEYSIDSTSLTGYMIDSITWDIRSYKQTPNQLDSITHESLWLCIPDPNPAEQNMPKKAYVFVNKEGNAKLSCKIWAHCGSTDARIIIYTDGYEYDDVSVEEVSYDDYINVYPNPTKGELYISFGDISTSPVTVSIYNFSGAEIMRHTESGNIAHMSIGNLSNGMYFVRITGKDFVVTKKFVLNK